MTRATSPPNSQGVQVPLTSTAPGRFEGNFPADSAGNYITTVTVNQNGKVTHTSRTGIAIAYTPEFEYLGTNTALLKQIAAAGGGVVLPNAAAALKVKVPSTTEPESLMFILLALAAILLPIDVAARRLVLSPIDQSWTQTLHVETVTDRVRQRIGRQESSTPKAPARVPAKPRAPSKPSEDDDDIAARILARRKQKQHDEVP